MTQVHIHVHLPAPQTPAADALIGAQAIGDGTLLRLIGEVGPKLLALLIQLGLIKLPMTAPAEGVAPTP
ncbi:hypothetical protein GobsT_37950 [Gemmata obscuriglobus]|uniref:Uncharacterized protein n=1 Tax=Gemmata obscuriglobus TaxID=114 RepID=A0A2Z3H1A7_9BACT|nr:hypothetical protein [Gemmata obscuriglobus]AWM38112.1 hypothetical protein C1280_14665 [Gemmata obscuriglobus]QEG29006.1 hypothetical protein GobsT_37950 [Gemmata obscuriglobus]VTS07587.1 unnamed protein product [Gemmata obscuriglobus UQM 2246]